MLCRWLPLMQHATIRLIIPSYHSQLRRFNLAAERLLHINRIAPQHGLAKVVLDHNELIGIKGYTLLSDDMLRLEIFYLSESLAEGINDVDEGPMDIPRLGGVGWLELLLRLVQSLFSTLCQRKAFPGLRRLVLRRRFSFLPYDRILGSGLTDKSGFPSNKAVSVIAKLFIVLKNGQR